MSKMRIVISAASVALFVLTGCGTEVEGPEPVPHLQFIDQAVSDAAAVCGEGTPCANGESCEWLNLESGWTQRCLAGAPCEMLSCPEDWTCYAELSSPARYTCARITSGSP